MTAPYDCACDAAGQHYAHSLTHKIEMKLHLETDPSEVLNEIIFCTRKVCMSCVNLMRMHSITVMSVALSKALSHRFVVHHA